jgi:hypothetical protein
MAGDLGKIAVAPHPYGASRIVPQRGRAGNRRLGDRVVRRPQENPCPGPWSCALSF